VVRGALVAPDDPELVKPVPVREPRLDYPALALARRIEGTVVLRALVDETGAVRDVRVVQPSGVRFGLDEAAVANTRRRRYRPASKDGVPVKTWVTIEVRFALP
jgi:protein TonB